MKNLRLFTSTFCPFCERVKMVIRDKNIDGIEIINIDENPKDRDYLIEKGGKKQVPCLFIGDTPMYESMDIVKYLSSL